MNKYRELFWGIVVMVLWGSIFPMIKIGYYIFGIDTEHIQNIIVFAGVRFVICGAVIVIFSWKSGRRMKLERAEIGQVMGVGIFAVILHYTCTYSGLTMADSSVTALLKQLGGFLFIPFSFLFFKEDKFSVRKLAGAICGFGGIVVLNMTDNGVHLGLGELLVVLASLCMVISNILGKNAMKTVDALVMTGWSQLFGGMILLVWGFWAGGSVGGITVIAVGVFMYICTASILGYCIWNLLVKKGSLSRLFVVKFLEPVFAAVFGAFLLGEDILNIRFLLALIFTGCAVAISNK